MIKYSILFALVFTENKSLCSGIPVISKKKIGMNSIAQTKEGAGYDSEFEMEM
jgi:hypothetical protein